MACIDFFSCIIADLFSIFVALAEFSVAFPSLIINRIDHDVETNLTSPTFLSVAHERRRQKLINYNVSFGCSFDVEGAFELIRISLLSPLCARRSLVNNGQL